MTNRYTRDEILTKGLNLVVSSPLDSHDRKGGLISSNAYCIDWLQQALDMAHKRFPFSLDITSAKVLITPRLSFVTLLDNPNLFLPEDFEVDVKDGLVVDFANEIRRLKRVSFPQWLDVYNSSFNRGQARPQVYAFWDNKLQIAPVTESGFPAALWHYRLPDVLGPSDKPKFPDEWVLVEFIRIKGKEFINQYPPGTAETYMVKQLARLKQSGLLHDAELDYVPLQQNVIAEGAITDRNLWMTGVR